MLEAISVSKAFEGRPVLRDISLAVSGTVAIMAPSGAGKTTLLRILLGLLAPDAGEVRTGGARVGAVFQEDRLIEHMTALQNLALVAGKASRAQLREHLIRLGLNAEADKRVSAFSGGMRRRVAIARAIVYQPDVLLLDEPFTGLDEEMRERTAQYILAHMRGKDIAIVTHDKEEARLLGAQKIFTLTDTVLLA